MSETTLTKPRRKTADYEALTAQMLVEIARLERQMDADHAVSERLKAETEVIKAHTTATIAQLQEQMRRLAKAA